MIVSDPNAWVFANTGLSKGDRLKNVVGPEYDRFDSSGPNNVQIMARSPVTCGGKATYSDMTYYTAPSGAGVWASGTNWWISKLSEQCSPLTSPTSAPTTTSPVTPTTFAVTPRNTRRPSICPKQAVTDMTENVLNLFGVGPAGRTHPSVATNLKTLNADTPPPEFGTTETTTRSRRSTPTSIYTRRSPVTTQPAYTPYTYPPQYTPPPSPPTTRPRRIIGN